MQTKRNKKAIGTGALLVALLSFINPNINIIDLIPDFIGAFIVAGYFSYLADRAPYFAEARLAFLKLGLVSLLKIPAVLVMTSVRSTNVSDNDIVVLFAFSFAVVEMIFFVQAIQNTFSGLFYLGERCESSALLRPFPIGKGKKRGEMTPEALKLMAIVTVAVKLCASVIPEVFMLTKGIDSTNSPSFNFYSAYPYATVICFVIALVVGIRAYVRFKAFVKHIKSEMDIYSEADKLIPDEIAFELDRRMTVKHLSFIMGVVLVSSFFVIEIREARLNEVSLVPAFVFPLLLIYAFYRMKDHIKVGLPVFISGGVSAAVSLMRWFVERAFLDGYGYTALVYQKDAKAAYIPTIVLTAVDAVSVGVFAVFVCITLMRLIREHTGVINGGDPSRIDVERRTYLNRTVIGFSVGAFSVHIAKLMNVSFKYFATIKAVAVEDEISNIVVSKYPWFGTVLFGLEILFVLYTAFMTSRIKDEIIFAYDDDGKL